MNNIKLRSLDFGTTTIKFNDGVNYILGKNGSGKTVWFSILQYSLGLKRNFSYFLSINKDKYTRLILEIDSIIYEFIRATNSREITIVSLDNKISFNVDSEEYVNYLSYVLNPKGFDSIDNGYIIPLVKESFISENLSERNIPSLRNNRETYTLLLGVNSVYPNTIKRYISELNSEIKHKEEIYKELNAYKDDALFIIKRELSNDNSLPKIQEILDSTLLKSQKRIKDLYEIYNKSKELLEDINLKNENSLNNISEQLQSEFLHYLSALNINKVDINLKYPFTYREGGYSYSKRGILNIIAQMVIQSNYQVTNGIGLLINDSNLIYLHSSALYEFRNLVRQICEHKSLQYFEFTSDYNSISSNEVVLDLGKDNVYA